MTLKTLKCPVCDSRSNYLDTVDFNKSCIGAAFVQSTPVDYYLCGNCRFCFAPIFLEWSKEQFLKLVYNDQYLEFDPEYTSTRPLRNAGCLLDIFQDIDKSVIDHIDYGSGSGVLSETLKDCGWASESFDSLIDKKRPERTFNLITAFEVLEHIPHVHQMFQDLSGLLRDDGIILITTALSDNTVVAHGTPLTWWYASPRNGHISLFSIESLCALARQYGFSVTKFSNRYYAMYRGRLPLWTCACKRPGVPCVPLCVEMDTRL